MSGIKILGTGKYVPEKIITNDDWAKLVETSDEWIVQRTGMKERHFAADDETTTSMGAAAVKLAIEDAGIDPQEVGALIVATVSADNYSPSDACLIQRDLGLRDNMIAFDISAGCSGFVFGLETMRGLLMSGGFKYGVLVASEILSRKMDKTDRSTCVLFGDGAAAAVISLDDNSEYYSCIGVHGDDELIKVPVPNGPIYMDGQATYKFAVSSVPKLINDVMEKAGVSPDDIDMFLLHQANLRIIEAVQKRLKQPDEKFFININKYGNTSAASVALAMDEAKKEGKLKPGMKVLLAGFGAGKTYGAIIFEW
ncbi:MAG: ketoacyl-ACP synthase III [Lachnospiraceae bacterium]|nr:ketoacyl-ACP synthase III [Lachnospiraceae bacterium]